jgi:iron complex transport system ATP-binding protein
MPNSILDLHDLCVGYPGPHRTRTVVSSGINLSLRSGELVCLLGPNGAGKSTLLRTIAGMQPPLQGKVLLGGRDIHSLPKRELARMLSVVLTERILAGMLTSYEVIALGRSPHTGWSGALRDEDHAIVEESIRAVEAAHLANRYVNELSDGERQKVMLARALAQEPVVMILDEITAFLDLPRRIEIMRILRDLAHKRDRAIVVSTHDLDLALANADRVWLLPKGAPLVAGTPEDLVLSGHFSSVFTGEGVTFDEEAGTFSMRWCSSGEIALVGEGSAARWTRRALERNGYRITSSGSLRLSVMSSQDRLVWELQNGATTQERTSIEDVLNLLKASHS